MTSEHLALTTVIGIVLAIVFWPNKSESKAKTTTKPVDEPLPEVTPTPILVPDNPDIRDWIYQPKVVAIPNSYSLEQYLLSIEDQLQTNSCTANATTSAYELIRNKLGLGITQLSRLFLYYASRTYSCTQGIDKGVQLRDSLKALHNYGVCSEEMWPFDVSKVNQSPDVEHFKAAESYLIKGYSRVYQNNIREAIAEGNPVIIAMYIRTGFGNGWVNYINQNIIGSHAMVVVGYDDTTQKYLVANSWNKSWDGDGLIEIPYWILKQECHDAWLITV